MGDAEKKASDFYERTVDLTLQDGGLVSTINGNHIGSIHNVHIEQIATNLAAEAGFEQGEKVRVYLRIDRKENKVNPPKKPNPYFTYIPDWS